MSKRVKERIEDRRKGFDGERRGKLRISPKEADSFGVSVGGRDEKRKEEIK